MRELLRWLPFPINFPIHSTLTHSHPSFMGVRVVYLQHLQHKLCELTPSKDNIMSHKNSFHAIQEII